MLCALLSNQWPCQDLLGHFRFCSTQELQYVLVKCSTPSSCRPSNRINVHGRMCWVTLDFARPKQRPQVLLLPPFLKKNLNFRHGLVMDTSVSLCPKIDVKRFVYIWMYHTINIVQIDPYLDRFLTSKNKQAWLDRTRKGGSPLVPALSGQSQTNKVQSQGRQ